MSKLPFIKLSESDSNIGQKSSKSRPRHSCTSEKLSDFNRVDILEQAEAYNKPKDGIKKLVLNSWKSKGCVEFVP